MLAAHSTDLSSSHVNSLCQHMHIAHASEWQAEDIANRVELAKATCLQKGLRFTPLREQVYRLILQAQQPIGAYDLLSQLQSYSDKPVAPPTVYRSLDFLLAHGFIHQLSSTKAFFACSQPDGQHTAAFFICQCCGDVQEFSHSPIHQMLTDVAKAAQFSISTSVIELSGKCGRCKNDD